MTLGEIGAARACGGVSSSGLVVGALVGDRSVLLLWLAFALGVTVATAAGYVALGSLDRSWAPHLQAFGAGALLAMTAETMIP